MIARFLSYTSTLGLEPSIHKILVATSGGIDSMVLVDLLVEAKFEIGLVHLNHSLRGEDANGDEEFIISYGKKKSIPTFTKKLDIKTMMTAEKANMHQLARRERYQLFESIRVQESYDFIVTAHHCDDKIEGFFINLLRGTGLKGLRGIQQDVRNVKRPLLYANKDDITHYARKHNIAYREDASNDSIKYSRNYIRHRLIPIIADIKPSYQKTISTSIEQLADSHQLLDYYIANNQSSYMEKDGNLIKIYLDKIISIPGNTTLLHSLVQSYGFTTTQVKSMLVSYQNTGAQFSTQSHEGLINRGNLIIRPKETIEDVIYSISIDSTVTVTGLGKLTVHKDKNTTRQALIAVLDHNKLQFPLTIRRWKAGDRFQPSGMNGQYKKVKKYLTDIKLSRFEKENTYVMLSGEDICWLIGHRVDHRFIGNDITIALDKE